MAIIDVLIKEQGNQSSPMPKMAITRVWTMSQMIKANAAVAIPLTAKMVAAIPNTREVGFSKAQMDVTTTARMRKSCGPG